MPKNVRLLVISVVTGVWCVNFTAPVFVSGYKAQPEVHIVFMAVIGVVLALPEKKDDDEK